MKRKYQRPQIMLKACYMAVLMSSGAQKMTQVSINTETKLCGMYL